MAMIDQVKIFVKSGNGGDGIVAFRHEKWEPNGGPFGGDGGRGGDVILTVDRTLNTLAIFQKGIHFKANDGERGGMARRTGASADDVTVRVPPGTVVKDANTGAVIADLVTP